MTTTDQQIAQALLQILAPLTRRAEILAARAERLATASYAAGQPKRLDALADRAQAAYEEIANKRIPLVQALRQYDRDLGNREARR